MSKFKTIQVPEPAIKIITAGNAIDLESRTNDWFKANSEISVISTSITTLEHTARNNSTVMNMLITYTRLVPKVVPTVELEIVEIAGG